MGKINPDKEKVCIIWKWGKKHSGHWFGDLLGKPVGEEGLWVVKSLLSEGPLSPSDSHSEEAGEEREDGGEEEE